MLTVRVHVGRSPQYECDHGYVGEAGVCVDWVPRSEREPLPEADRTPCGKGGEPVCAGDMLNGVHSVYNVSVQQNIMHACVSGTVPVVETTTWGPGGFWSCSVHSAFGLLAVVHCSDGTAMLASSA